MFIFLFILSLVLYLCAPNEYSQSYCICIALLYIFECSIFLKHEVQNKNYITFNSIFLVSFFFVSYAFAAFISGSTGEVILSSLVKRVDLRYMTRAVALSHLAINCYFLGFINIRNLKGHIKSKSEIPQYRNNTILIRTRLSKCIYLLSFIAVLINYIFHFFSGESVAVTENPFLYDIYRCILVVVLVSSTIKNVKPNSSIIEYCKKNFLYLSTALLYMLVCLMIGDRGPVIFCSIVLAATYLVIVKRLKGSFIFTGIDHILIPWRQ